MEDLIEKLKDIGFNTYEAKVYLTLLKHHPATGYEVSKESGVPQARAYDTLKALENAGVVVPIDGKPVTYLPISPSELLDRHERSFKNSINFLRDSLPNMGNETIEPILNIRGSDSTFKQIRDMIEHAKQSIFIEIWSDDALAIEDNLRRAAARGVDIKIVGYNQVPFTFCDVYAHGLAQDIETSLGGRWLIMSVDDSEGIIGHVPTTDSSPRAVYTRNPGIVFIIKELVVHDIFLLDVEKNLQNEIEHVYGHTMMKLRNKIFGEHTSVMVHH
ncbi:MAG: hypothetical protein K2X01_07265 [Cyanobacteria bacterium]|nr:hypothetical protein [Cyanobacteriota bacterium]